MFQVNQLTGKYAVVTTNGVQFECPIKIGGQGAYNVFDQHRFGRSDHPCTLFFDGFARNEYGRPLDRAEVSEALALSGYERVTFTEVCP